MKNCWEFLSVCIERSIGLDNIVLAVIGIFGLFSIFLTYRQLRFGKRALQIDVALRIHDDFLENEKLRDFLYSLDYESGPKAWKFDPKTFPQSDGERYLDLLLLKLSIIGSLIKSGDLGTKDLQWLKVNTQIILENKQVLKYLEWVQTPNQIPGHSSFEGAIYLYKELFGRSGPAYNKLVRYLEQMQ